MDRKVQCYKVICFLYCYKNVDMINKLKLIRNFYYMVCIMYKVILIDFQFNKYESVFFEFVVVKYIFFILNNVKIIDQVIIKLKQFEVLDFYMEVIGCIYIWKVIKICKSERFILERNLELKSKLSGGDFGSMSLCCCIT